MKKPKIVIVLPAYNAERTLERVFKGIPKGLSVLLCDDKSKDGTTKLSKKLGIKTIIHPQNLGYGANQKTLYKNALKMGADFIIMLHPDGQYDPKDLPKFIRALKDKKGDLILGSRFLGTKNETPFYKSVSIKIITLLFNLILKVKLSEVNSGYRGFSRGLLNRVPFDKNGNGYIFDPQMIIQAKYFGFKIAEVPVSKVYNPERISPNFSKSVEHGLENLKLLIQYLLHRFHIREANFPKD